MKVKGKRGWLLRVPQVVHGMLLTIIRRLGPSSGSGRLKATLTVLPGPEDSPGVSMDSQTVGRLPHTNADRTDRLQ